jgi:hypothetical protein
MRPPVKFSYAASVTLIVGALLSAGVAFLTYGALTPRLVQGSPKSGQEAPEVTREQQQIGVDVVAVMDPPSDAQLQPSSLTALPGAAEPASSTELPTPSAPSSSPQLPSPVERSGLTELPTPVEGSLSPEFPRAVETNPVVDTSYRFAARRQGQTLFVEGYVPDERTGRQLMAFARERFFDVAVVNQARLHDGAPTGFSAGARFALEQLSFLASGEALLRDKSIRLSGEALYLEAGEQTCAKIALFAPHGWTGTASIKWRQENADENALPACQSRHIP